MSALTPVKPPPHILQWLLDNYEYDPNTGIITGKKRKRALTSTNSKGYITIKYLRAGECRNISGHHIAWYFTYGEWTDKQLDHINRIKTDNRITNLRQADQKLNANNRVQRTGTGVYFYKQRSKYFARWGKKYLGLFVTEVEALNAVAKYKETIKHIINGDEQ